MAQCLYHWLHTWWALIVLIFGTAKFVIKNEYTSMQGIVDENPFDLRGIELTRNLAQLKIQNDKENDKA
jgi:hypothetical protein